jgi:hypothetical protein
MSALTKLAIFTLSFLVSAGLLAKFQTWVRRNVPPPSAPANLRRCLWVAFVCGVWWPWAVLSQWNAQGAAWNVWASLEDQRLFLVGAGPALWVVGLTSVVQPWAYSIRTWLLGANLVAFGLFYGLFVGTAAWPGNLFTYQGLFWPAVGFVQAILFVLRSKPGQSWERGATRSECPASTGRASSSS